MPGRIKWQCSVCGFIAESEAPPERCPICDAPWTAFQKMPEPLVKRLAGIPIAEKRPARTKYVIIGNSSAGRSAAAVIRQVDRNGVITVLSEESTRFYYRPILPDYIGGMEEEKVFATTGGAISDKDLAIKLNKRVVRVKPDQNRLMCEDGEVVDYDYLLLATGSIPIAIPWPGSDAEGVFYFRTFEDAKRILRMAENAERAVVVGGGLLGLEFIRGVRLRGLAVTHLVRENRVGVPALDDAAGAMVERRLRADGVEVILEDEVASFESADGKIEAVLTKSGRRIECDLVGVAVGVRPRIELAEDTGIQTDRGFLVDERMRTNVLNIFAAGDCAQAFDVVAETPRVNTSWRTAREQGEAAGFNMVGADFVYPGSLPANAQMAGGLPFASIGLANPEEERYDIESQSDVIAETYRKMVRLEGNLVGALLLGDISGSLELEDEIRLSNTPAR